MYSAYFDHIELPSDDVVARRPSKLVHAYLVYLNKQTERYRAELNRAPKSRTLILTLHQKEAKHETELRWMKKVLAAYEFHRQCADRQRDEIQRQIKNLRSGDLLLWVDWKQNITLPLSQVSTGDMYWATSRMETSLLGAIAYIGSEDGPPKKLGLLWISDVLDHTSLAASMQMQEMMTTCLGPLSRYRNIALWYDTGPHYRTVDMVSFVAQQWLWKENRLDLACTLNFFTEKHGKGEVDALFAGCNRWAS